MRTFCLYFGEVDGPADRVFDWTMFDLVVLAIPSLPPGPRLLDYLSLLSSINERVPVYVYRHGGQIGTTGPEPTLEDILQVVDGVFLDHTGVKTAEARVLYDRVVVKQHKQLVFNTGWSTVFSPAYVGAALLESFVGSHDETASVYPAKYGERPLVDEILKVKKLRHQGTESDLFALCYGPSSGHALARRAGAAAEVLGLDFFCYTQPPGWRHPRSDFRLARPPQPTGDDTARAQQEVEIALRSLVPCSACQGGGACLACSAVFDPYGVYGATAICPDCRGTQRCSTCEGAGLRKR